MFKFRNMDLSYPPCPNWNTKAESMLYVGLLLACRIIFQVMDTSPRKVNASGSGWQCKEDNRCGNITTWDDPDWFCPYFADPTHELRYFVAILRVLPHWNGFM
jgi:hypothetical protein